MGPAMGENEGIDPLSTIHTVPIERPNFEYLLLHHETATAMAAVMMTRFGDDRCR
jgi:hypothetical protein